MPTMDDRIDHLLSRDFGTLSELVAHHADSAPHRIALHQGDRSLTYRQLNALMDRVAAALARDGIVQGASIAICASTTIEYAATFLGALRAGVAVAPLAPSSTPEALVAMTGDSGAERFFLDAQVAQALRDTPGADRPPRVMLDDALESRDTHGPAQSFTEWLAPEGTPFDAVTVDPFDPFNIIYSSGTTGTPKGIVQPHVMRWRHVQRGRAGLYGPSAVTIISTPLYSNTTLVSFIPTLALGGSAVLMEKFDSERFLALAQRHRATHAMLVPVQYRRLLSVPDFDRYDLSSFRMKFCTSAPFPAELKAEVLRRWPGGLVEYYGMTEGGGTCVLAAHEFPHKLHTVGRPSEGHDIRLIDDDGREVPAGGIGEVVGRSGSMMTGYHNLPDKTLEAHWVDSAGNRFIRTGDVGRFDEDGFLVLMDRKKDMIISGGFNIYPSDIEAVVAGHPAVLEVAVVGVPSARWGETPVAFVALRAGCSEQAEVLRIWANERLGKTQRLAAVEIVNALPRSHIGKVLKRELREGFRGTLAQ
jgi:long-chain acyl-CoA synthetase